MEYSEEIKLTFFCSFQFADFPFDVHECQVEFGDDEYGTSGINFETAIIAYRDSVTSIGDPPIILNHLPFPFEFQLAALPAFEKVYDDNYSYTGMLLKMKRKSLGQLLSGYYYPTGAFAILSLISYLIKPDEVHISVSKGRDVPRDVPGQTGTGRPIVPLSRDKNSFLSRCPVVPGQGQERMSWDKLLCPGQSQDKTI